MAKSTRSKVKRSFRNKKRETGVYAATEAARLQRLNLKLQQTIKSKEEGEADADPMEATTDNPALEPSTPENHSNDTDSMQIDTESQSKRISTHGPRGSRREEWRKSKGLAPRPASRGMNRQGLVAGRRKSGRSKRRR
ncbi:hypothetical protein Agabi119p4_4774 [Agaricus bisporus var. burnettii]|uniref:DUF2423 domain-containing protein n=1 Tax=Agaricus bisporus var. burnettii TaxID=192524 RepID=A0A8H7F3Z2_AGABI|nr:hypothetical protein Agabi119p4_4774 [Agaricus bisporus var. burnettii]